MPQIILPAEYVSAPWKNGGGVTHEIARGKGDPWQWRLSIAEVASDGLFSRFEGLNRILTVIDGAGIDLVMPDAIAQVRPLEPLSFSGDTPVRGRLMDGPIRDLNVIYDPDHIAASVRVIGGSGRLVVGQGTTAVLCLDGGVMAAWLPIPPGACALFAPDEAVDLSPDARALLVTLEPVGYR